MKYTPSIENLNSKRPFYVVATCIAVDQERGKGLLLRRAETQRIHPGLWAPIGGKLEWDDFTDRSPSRNNGVVDDWEGILEHLVAREAMEEANIEIDSLMYLDSVLYVRPDGMPTVCLKFAGRYAGGDVRFPDDFSDAGWFAAGELSQSEAVLGVASELDKAITLIS